MQAQFLAGQAAAQPAARVTRVSRRPHQQQPPLHDNVTASQTIQQRSSAVSSLAEERQQQQHHATLQQATEQQQQEQPIVQTTQHCQERQQQDEQQQEQLCPPIPGILTNVQERAVSSARPPGLPSAAAAIAAFPKAVHRKQSKVCVCGGGGKGGE